MSKMYRPLDKKRDWEFFDDALPIAMEDLSQIRVLTEEHSQELWRKYVEPKNSERDDKESLIRTFENSQVKTEWMEKWDQGEGEGIVSFLFSHVTWPIETKVLFFWSKQESVETTWKVFLKHWMNFLFNDEWAILLSPTQPERIVFSPNGELCVTK
jgi:hypothetical protein